MRQVDQRVSVRVELAAARPRGRRRIRCAPSRCRGRRHRTASPFRTDALDAIYRATNGNPRLINLVVRQVSAPRPPGANIHHRTRYRLEVACRARNSGACSGAFTRAGSSDGTSSSADTHTGSSADTHTGSSAVTRTGTSADIHAGSGADTHAGSGANTQTGSGADTHTGSGTRSGSGTRTRAGARTHTGTRSATWTGIAAPVFSHSKVRPRGRARAHRRFRPGRNVLRAPAVGRPPRARHGQHGSGFVCECRERRSAVHQTPDGPAGSRVCPRAGVDRPGGVVVATATIRHQRAAGVAGAASGKSGAS